VAARHNATAHSERALTLLEELSRMRSCSILFARSCMSMISVQCWRPIGVIHTGCCMNTWNQTPIVSAYSRVFSRFQRFEVRRSSHGQNGRRRLLPTIKRESGRLYLPPGPRPEGVLRSHFEWRILKRFVAVPAAKPTAAANLSIPARPPLRANAS
jgi:hypothetical protein